MPFPLTPPPLIDTGAWTCPRTLQRWLDKNPVGALTRVGSYITLPAFDIQVPWNGYSEIIASFNYEGPNNFSLQIDSTRYVIIVTGTPAVVPGTSPPGSDVTISGSGDVVGVG